MISNNTKGNPYHDPKTGKFTTAGVSAVKKEIESGGKHISNKTKRLEKQISSLDIEDFVRIGAHKGGKNLRYYIDDNLSMPLVMKHKKEICSNLMCDDIILNNNDGLDKIGIDLIGFNNDKDIDEDSIYECQFIDVKTSYSGSVSVPIFNSEPDMNHIFSMKECWVLNPLTKMTNAFVFQFIQERDRKSNEEKVRELYTNGAHLYAEQNIVSHSIYAFDATDVRNILNKQIRLNDLRYLFNNYSKCFDENGTLTNPNLFGDTVMKLGTPKPIRGKEGYFRTRLVDKETGFSIKIEYNLDKPFCDVSCSADFPERLFERDYPHLKVL